ncbi:2-hydroxyacid dehydrogenase [Minwuia thermotolerans]|uniref:2-hydroxyacid dehydrogenase n=1 Tax=Minwuia thermotolerans TaxID=2056226 RepID=UPI0013DE77F1|nr:2-hydroxyacid dehydrogenase [Minwuia thermotolerans]
MTRLLLLAGKQSMKKADFLAGRLETDWRIEACDPAADRAAFERLAPEAEAIVGGYIARPWPATPRLKLYQIPFTGHDFLEPEVLPAGCRVCNTYEHETSIAEYILLAMLEWEIGLSKTAARFRERSWDGKGPAEGPVHGEVRGKTVGIVGYGHIGREVAIRARAFGMNVIGIGRREQPTPDLLDWYGTTMEIDRLMAEADYVVVACPLNEATRGLLDADRLGAMKPTGVVINVGRGAIIDEDAIYDALKNGRIGGAVIDVWWRYPGRDEPNPRPSRHPLHELDNVIMTPHNSGWTQEQIDRRWVFVASNLDRIARGEPPENVVMTI